MELMHPQIIIISINDISNKLGFIYKMFAITLKNIHCNANSKTSLHERDICEADPKQLKLCNVASGFIQMQLQAKSGLWIYVDVDYLASQANFTMIFQNYRSVSLKDTCHHCESPFFQTGGWPNPMSHDKDNISA